MWNFRNLFVGIFMVILDVIAIRGVIATHSSMYYIGVFLCTLLAFICLRNIRR